MLELRWAIVECQYPDDVQELLKRPIHLWPVCQRNPGPPPGEIVPEDTAEKCLLES